ncbi:MAG TPA: hypothetical protein VHD32_18675 [Candidatus Didemnitutus sp.]|nr:hypothetical protein [Candidatus Didemnitutus sp.]
MKTTHRFSGRSSERGSAFITVLIFVFVLIGIASTLIKWSVEERALNQRAGYWLEARNAAEATAEYGFSQISTEFSSMASPPTFDPAQSTKLQLPPTSFFTGGNVDTTAWSTSHQTGIQLIGGTAQTVPANGTLYYVDPTDPNNRLDPLKGQWVYRRDIQVLARATVVPVTTANPVTAYVTETVSVRGAPLFSHAIFYSANDLEIFPGPTMNIYGPVHTNGNMFVSSQGSSVNFHGAVSMSGNLYHAWANSNSAAEGAGGETLGQSPVNFLMSDNSTLKNLNSSGTTSSNGASTDWRDSTYGASNNVTGLTNLTALVTSSTTTNFRQFASQNFNGNLQTSAMNIQPYYPVAYNETIDAAGDKPDPHVMIDAPNSSLSTTDPYYSGKSQVESSKMSMQSGLYVQVDMTNLDASGNPSISFYGPPGSAPVGTPSNMIGPNGGIKLTAPLNQSNGPSNANPPLVKYIPFRQLKKVVNSSGNATYTVLKADGTTDAVMTTAANSGATGAPPKTGQTANTTTYSIYSDSTLDSNSTYGNKTTGYGMYDQRRGTAAGTDWTSHGIGANDPGSTDVVQVDMKALSAAVTSMATNTLDGNNSIKNNAGSAIWADATQWNGGVYIDVKTANNSASTPYATGDYNASLSSQTTSVRLVDGTVTSGSSLIPSFGVNNNGLTIATNAQVYIKGNFNADGSSASATMPDDGHTGSATDPSVESPVCIAADAVTLLSNSWSDLKSVANNNAAGSTEYATAILTGLQKTTNSDSSGGVHNLPRFLENWGGQTATIRGSLVTMYDCKVATQAWSTNYYSPPARNWGFDNIFKNGHYPPITPKVMSYRRVLFTSLTSSGYTSAAHTLWPSEF